MKKIAVIIGGSGAIGQEVCKKIVGLGFITYCTYFSNGTKAENVAKTLNGELICKRCDVRNHKDVEQLFEEIVTQHQRIDVLVNCAGISGESLFVNKTIDEWKNVIETNLFKMLLKQICLVYFIHAKQLYQLCWSSIRV